MTTMKVQRTRKKIGLTEFPLFTKLPFEIQNEIWEIALYDGLAVNKLCITAKPTHEGNFYAKGAITRRGRVSSATLLLVCKRSRSIARKVYHLTFDGTLRYPIWFNAEIDIMSFDCDSIRTICARRRYTQLPRADYHTVRYIIVPNFNRLNQVDMYHRFVNGRCLWFLGLLNPIHIIFQKQGGPINNAKRNACQRLENLVNIIWSKHFPRVVVPKITFMTAKQLADKNRVLWTFGLQAPKKRYPDTIYF